ncbi:kinase-like domain-containing protein [Gongronella butleri]|nr:kinase-like domain-containing protein [Gongronella butleri]
MRLFQFASSTRPPANARDYHTRRKPIINNYQLVKTIGRGVSGDVKLGIHLHTGEQVAIKIIPRARMRQSPTVSRAVERELAVLQLLHHPCLVDLQHVMQDEHNVYFVMEYMTGGDLFQHLIQQRHFPENDAKAYFHQLMLALHWCHQHHICHRDIKLENILLDHTKKQLKLSDFGMAIMQSPNTRLHTSCGSPHYASPEIIKGTPYSGPASDVWSSGVVLYLLLTGHHPFDDKRTGRLLRKIKAGRYISLPRHVPSHAKDLVSRMLVVDPSKRISVPEILAHPWLQSDTEKMARSSSQTSTSPDFLALPLVTSANDVEGWIWKTMNVLWRDVSTNDMVQALSGHGFNAQKQTFQLLRERGQRLTATATEKSRLWADREQKIQASASSVSLPLAATASSSSCATPPVARCRPTAPSTPKMLPTTTHCESYLSSSSTLYEDAPSKAIDSFVKDDQAATSVSWQRGLFLGTHGQPTSLISNASLYASTASEDRQLLNLQLRNKLAHGSKPFYYDNALSAVMRRHLLKSSALRLDSSYASVSHNSNYVSSLASTLGFATQQSSTLSHLAAGTVVFDTLSFCKKMYQHTSDFFQHVFQPVQCPKAYTIQSLGKHDWEAAGQFNHVFQEYFNGQLSHRGYCFGQSIWTGTMQPFTDQPKRTVQILCHIPCTPTSGANTHAIKASFVLIRGHPIVMKAAMDRLDTILSEFERDVKLVTESNGWITAAS